MVGFYKVAILLSLWASIYCSCAGPENQVKLRLDGVYDFTTIGEALSQNRIVAIGESSHGIGDYYRFKSELVQYLHEHHNYETLAFEAGIGDLNLAWTHIDQLTSQELLTKTLFSNYQCEEISGLFDYIKANYNTAKPLIYTGFDNQMSSRYFLEFIKPTLKEYRLDIYQDLDHRMNAYSRWYLAGQAGDSVAYYEAQQEFQNTSQEILALFEDQRSIADTSEELSLFEYQIIKRTLRGFIKSVDLTFENRYDGIELRDSIMFDNFQWLINDIYPDKKIIIWAHNGHVEQGPMPNVPYRWLGHYLNDHYGDEYYALGLFAQKGQSFRHWDGSIFDFNHTDSTMIEQLGLRSEDQVRFIDFDDTDQHVSRWSRDTISGYEVENRGYNQFVPAERFDGVVVFRNVSAPTYD